MFISNIDFTIMFDFNSHDLNAIKIFIRNKLNLPKKSNIVLFQACNKGNGFLKSNEQIIKNRIVYFMLEDVLFPGKSNRSSCVIS